MAQRLRVTPSGNKVLRHLRINTTFGYRLQSVNDPELLRKLYGDNEQVFLFRRVPVSSFSPDVVIADHSIEVDVYYRMVI